MVALLLPTQPMPHWRLAGTVPLVALALTAAVADALHQNSPGAVRVTHGVAVPQPVTHSWGCQVPFSSREDLTHTANSRRQIFLFGLFDYDCQNPTPGPALSCPAVPPPAVTQVTTGPGNPDNPSIGGTGNVIAFDADGAYAGGTGPGVGHRQIFLKDLSTSQVTRVTDAADGDSTRPSLTYSGGLLVFESTAPLLGGLTGISQVFFYLVKSPTLLQVTNGAGPSTLPSVRKLGKMVAFESTAALLGDGHDTGVSQIFWYDRGKAQLHQLTGGDGPSHHPVVTPHSRLAPALGRAGHGPAIFFDSAAPRSAGSQWRNGDADLPRADRRRRPAADRAAHADPGRRLHAVRRRHLVPGARRGRPSPRIPRDDRSPVQRHDRLSSLRPRPPGDADEAPPADRPGRRAGADLGGGRALVRRAVDHGRPDRDRRVRTPASRGRLLRGPLARGDERRTSAGGAAGGRSRRELRRRRPVYHRQLQPGERLPACADHRLPIAVARLDRSGGGP